MIVHFLNRPSLEQRYFFTSFYLCLFNVTLLPETFRTQSDFSCRIFARIAGFASIKEERQCLSNKISRPIRLKPDPCWSQDETGQGLRNNLNEFLFFRHKYCPNFINYINARRRRAAFCEARCEIKKFTAKKPFSHKWSPGDCVLPRLDGLSKVPRRRPIVPLANAHRSQQKKGAL